MLCATTGRGEDLSADLMEKFKQFSLETGILPENIAVLPKNGMFFISKSILRFVFFYTITYIISHFYTFLSSCLQPSVHPRKCLLRSSCQLQHLNIYQAHCQELRKHFVHFHFALSTVVLRKHDGIKHDVIDAILCFCTSAPSLRILSRRILLIYSKTLCLKSMCQ